MAASYDSKLSSHDPKNLLILQNVFKKKILKAKK